MPVEKSCIIKMNVDVVTIESLIKKIQTLLIKKNGSYICVSNVHMCMEVNDSKEFEAVVNQADFVVPDGRPIFWAQKLLGYKSGSQIRGMDLMYALCSLANEKRLKLGFYGGRTDELLNGLVNILSHLYPNAEISYAYSPPFRSLHKNERNKVLVDITDSDVDILFVGIGCPKQERWMAENKGSLNCMMVGVGAAFDFIVDGKKHAPRWIQYFGFEWLYRLISEPRRLWRRYLFHNPRFIYYFIVQLIKNKIK